MTKTISSLRRQYPLSVFDSRWAAAPEGAEEFFFMVRPQGQGGFAAQADSLFAAYETALAEAGLDAETIVTATVFLSDAANQEALLRRHAVFSALCEAGGAVTVIEQPPAGAKLGMLAYHVRRQPGAEHRQRLTVPGAKSNACGLAIVTPAYRFVYLKNLASLLSADAAGQAEDLLGTPDFAAQSNGVALARAVRTWLYVRDIDRNYRAVSGARNRVFHRHGITIDGGFPASTGIAGHSADPADLLVLDLLAIDGLKPEQCRRMEAPTHMNPTVEYQVTFERGREVVFGDRRHLYVSGTASIDHRGQILHPGAVERQTERAIDNMAALLGNSGAALSDLRYVIVYLRDVADAAAVEAIMAESPLAGQPRIILHAPVCRPGWLVELEGVAIDGKGDGRFPAF
jgi:enamine deaminase RidA (YjgF/YER057c/UK114 family)